MFFLEITWSSETKLFFVENIGIWAPQTYILRQKTSILKIFGGVGKKSKNWSGLLVYYRSLIKNLQKKLTKTWKIWTKA